MASRVPCPVDVRVQTEPFDAQSEADKLLEARTDVGALVTFQGLCRDENGRLEALELEHYPGMAEAEIARVANEAAERWPLQGVRVIHRHGRLVPGEEIVFVATASAHRRAAFEAADFLMDYLKDRAPFWKKEHLVGGGDGGWIEAKASDQADAARWAR